MPRNQNDSDSEDEDLVEELEEDEATDDDQDEDVDGADGDGTDEDDEKSFDEDAFMAKVESRIDRRLNAVLREVRKMQQGQPQQQRQSGKQQQQPQVSVDARGAMAAYRDYVGDELRFSGREEREAATRMAKGLIAQRFADGETDEDEIGSQVAKDVAATINGLRKQADTRVKATLKRQGLLVEQPGQAGVQGKGKVPGVQSELRKGAALAAARHNRGQ